jgi:hypothetical protein
MNLPRPDQLLQFLHKLALMLGWLRPILLALAVMGVVVSGKAMLDGSQLYDMQLKLGLLFSLWCLILYATLQLFRQLPPPVLPKLSLYERVRNRLNLWLRQGLAVFIIVVTIILFRVSFRLLTI